MLWLQSAGRTAGRVDVPLCASSCLPPPPAHTARLLIGGNQQEESSSREICQVRSRQPTLQNLQLPHAVLPHYQKYCARVFGAGFGGSVNSGYICGRCCRIWERVTRSEHSGNTEQRASVWGWLRTSWSWSAMERAAGTRRTASAAGSTRTWARPASRRRGEEDRRWKVPDKVTQGLIRLSLTVIGLSRGELMQRCRMGKQVVGSLRHKTSQQHGRDREEGGRDSVTVGLSSGSVDIKKNWSEFRHLSESLSETRCPLRPWWSQWRQSWGPWCHILLHLSFWSMIYLYRESKPI